MSGGFAGAAAVGTDAEVGAVPAPGASGSPTPGTVDPARPNPNLPLAWAELLRLPALFTVPGDALAGAAATGVPHNSRTLLAIGSSLCLYEAGMTLNDWADREEDAAERPHRPLPSGRIRPTAAFTAACALTATGLALAARAGRPALSVAAPLAATVWAYDLHLKHTPAGPAAMATARALDLLLGAAATSGRTREALPSAALLGTHTLAVTTVSRHETRGGSSLAPLAALSTTALLTGLMTRGTFSAWCTRREPPAHAQSGTSGTPSGHSVADTPSAQGAPRIQRPSPAAPDTEPHVGPLHRPPLPTPSTTDAALRRPALPSLLRQALAAYAVTAARPYFHATLNPSPPLTQRAVSGGIRATIPLQSALAARSGATATALLVAALAPLGRRFAGKVGVT